MINRITPNVITELKPNQVLIFGSNSEGRHKKGMALFALNKCGAILGQSKGLQGQSYAIVTKKNWWQKRSSTLNEIQIEILDLVLFAMEHPELTFLVTKIGTENAGYSIEEIAPLFIDCIHQRNIHLPVEFWDNLNTDENREVKDIMGIDIGTWEDQKEEIIKKTKIKFEILK